MTVTDNVYSAVECLNVRKIRSEIVWNKYMPVIPRTILITVE